MFEDKTRKNICEIKKLSQRFPKTISEALCYSGLDEDTDDDYTEHNNKENTYQPKSEGVVSGTVNIDNFISHIRRLSLEMMSKLADTPDNPVYDFSKKIFQLAEKTYDEQKGKNAEENTDF